MPKADEAPYEWVTPEICLAISWLSLSYRPGPFIAVEVFTSLQTEVVLWKKGILSMPDIITSSVDIMHDILEGLTALNTAIKQKPAMSAQYTGVLALHDQQTVLDLTSYIKDTILALHTPS